MQNVMQIATNAGHTAQNDGRNAQNDGQTTQNDGLTTQNDGCKMTAATHLMFAKDQRVGLRCTPGPQGTPSLILEKTLVSRNDV